MPASLLVRTLEYAVLNTETRNRAEPIMIRGIFLEGDKGKTERCKEGVILNMTHMN